MSLTELKQGDALPELKVTPDKYLPHRYAGASGTSTRSTSTEFARRSVCPGTSCTGSG